MEKGKRQLNSHMFENIYKDLNIDLDSLGCILFLYIIYVQISTNMDFYKYNKKRK